MVKLIDLQFAQFSGRRVEHTGDEELAEFFAISDGQLGVVSQWVIFRRFLRKHHMYVSTAGRLDRMWTLDDVEKPELVVVTGHALPHSSKCRKSIHVFGCVLDQWRRNVFAPYQGRLGAAPPPPRSPPPPLTPGRPVSSPKMSTSSSCHQPLVNIAVAVVLTPVIKRILLEQANYVLGFFQTFHQFTSCFFYSSITLLRPVDI